MTVHCTHSCRGEFVGKVEADVVTTMNNTRKDSHLLGLPAEIWFNVVPISMFARTQTGSTRGL
jgi:hypothetical protein